jgi:hypothetical protein
MARLFWEATGLRVWGRSGVGSPAAPVLPNKNGPCSKGPFNPKSARFLSTHSEIYHRPPAGIMRDPTRPHRRGGLRQIAGAFYGVAGIPGEWISRMALRERIEGFAERLREGAPGGNG